MRKFLPVKKTAAVGLLAASSLIFNACGSKQVSVNVNAANAAPTVVAVATTQAVVRPIPTYFEATGNLASDAQSDVAPTVAGKITEVGFDVGSYVNKGDVMVRLDARDAQIRLEQAQGQANQARSQIEQVQATVRQAEAGVGQARANQQQQQIRLGLTQGDNFNIEDFSQVIAIKAQLAFAEKELVRAEKLLLTGDVSRSFRDQKLAARDQLAGQLIEARSNAAVAVKAISVSAEAVKAAQAQADTARANVKTSQAAYNTALTGIEQARKAIGDTAIYAPFSGYVSERSADLGEYISPSAPNAKIATLVRTSVLRLKIDIPEQSIGKIAVGQGISAQVSAYPDRNFAGTVVRLAPNVNATSRTLTVEAEIENIGGLLKPGQFATVRITQAKPEPGVMIPAVAVRSDGNSSRVFVIKDGVANERQVQTGLLENDLIEIKQGVQENEMVAVSNADKLSDGVIVNQQN